MHAASKKSVKPRTKKTTRTYKKKPTKGGLVTLSVPGDCPVPDVYNCQFHYGERLSLTATGSNSYSAEFIYAGNSIYDPDVSAGGNQPYFYDQLVAPSSGNTGLYKKYLVRASRIELEFSVSSNNTVPVYVWLLPVSSNNASLPVAPPDLDEYPRNQRLMLSTAAGGASTKTLTGYLPTYIHENISYRDWAVNNYDYEGSYFSSPIKMPYWYIVVKPADGASTVIVYMKVRMTYWTELSERNQELALS